MKRITGIFLRTVLPLGLGFYLVWFFFQSMNPKVKTDFYQAIGDANYFWIVLSLLLSFLSLLSRAYRWNYLLEPMGYKTPFWHRYHAIMIGYIMNLTIPRAGEATRAGMLFRSDGVPFSKSFGTILAERVFDVFMLLSVVLIAIFVGSSDFWNLKSLIEQNFSSSPENQSTIQWIKWILILAFIAGIGALFLLKSLRNKVIQFAKGLISGVLAVFQTKHPFAFIGHTLFIWVMYVVYFGVCFYALPETSNMSYTGMLLAFLAGSIGITLTNGGIGVFPLVVGLVIEYYLKDQYGDNAQGIGYALGMIIWSSQTLLLIVLGAISLVLIPKNFSKNDETRTINE